MKLTKDNCRAIDNQVNFYIQIDIPEIKEGLTTYGWHQLMIPVSDIHYAERIVKILTKGE